MHIHSEDTHAINEPNQLSDQLQYRNNDSKNQTLVHASAEKALILRLLTNTLI